MSSSQDLLPYTVLIIDANDARRAQTAKTLSPLCFVQQASSMNEVQTICQHVPVHIFFAFEPINSANAMSVCTWAAQAYPDSVRLLHVTTPTISQIIESINDSHVWNISIHPLNNDELVAIVNDAINSYIRKNHQTATLSELSSENDALRRKADQRTRELIALNEELRSILDRMQTLVITDELTGLYNRKMLINELDSLFRQSQRYQMALSCVVCDIEGFKGWNEEQGHEAGDAILCEVAMRIQQQLREVDIACRAGGDAFSFILPHTNSAQARIAIERIDKAIREQPFIIDNHSFHFHAHFGIAEATSSVENAHELFRRAEHAERMSREDGCPIPIITYPDPENGVTDSVA